MTRMCLPVVVMRDTPTIHIFCDGRPWIFETIVAPTLNFRGKKNSNKFENFSNNTRTCTSRHTYLLQKILFVAIFIKKKFDCNFSSLSSHNTSAVVPKIYSHKFPIYPIRSIDLSESSLSNLN